MQRDEYRQPNAGVMSGGQRELPALAASVLWSLVSEMPNRILREGILTSEIVCSLSWAAEVFYRRLQSVVDDYGRFSANPTLIRSSCYPLQIDKVSDSDVGKWLTQVVEAGLVRVYPASDGKRYLQVEKFNQRVQSKSKYPDPPNSTVLHCDPAFSTVDNRLDEGVVEDGDGSTRKRRRKPIKTQLPADFAVSDRVKEWAAQKGHTRLDEHLESFRAKCSAKGYEYADWDSAFMEAIRQNWARIASQARDESPASSRSLREAMA